MTITAVAAGVISVAAWVYLLLGRGMFWRETHKCSTWSNCGKVQNGSEARVVAVVPARNERETIGRCVTSLFGQEFKGTLHVIVVDDQSTDGTAEAARAVEFSHLADPKPGATTTPAGAKAARAGDPGTRVGQPGSAHIQNRADVGHRQLTVINGKALPEGWTGKVWAMQQGIEAAQDLNPKYLLLTDADVVHAADSVATLLKIAEDGGYDLVSFMVRLYCQSLPERLLIPAFVFFFFLVYPPRWVADRRRATAGAAGGCMLLRPEALERAGGMAAIRGEVIDDCALARAIKKTPGLANPGPDRGTREGGVWLGLSDTTASVRPYGSFAEIGRMVSRSAFKQLRHSALLLAGALAGMVVAFVIPVALVLLFPTLAKTELGWATHGLLYPTSANPGQMWGTIAVILGAVAWALMTLAYLPMVRYYRLNPLWAATLPLAACFYMGATLHSAVKYWSGRGGEWKGRVQDQGSRRKAQG